jgi:hypothetical protein
MHQFNIVKEETARSHTAEVAPGYADTISLSFDPSINRSNTYFEKKYKTSNFSRSSVTPSSVDFDLFLKD